VREAVSRIGGGAGPLDRPVAPAFGVAATGDFLMRWLAGLAAFACAGSLSPNPPLRWLLIDRQYTAGGK